MSRRLTVVILVLVVAALAGSVAGCGGDLPKDAVAKVGDAYITEADFDQRVAEVAMQYGLTEEGDPEYYKILQAEVMSIMVENTLAVIKAEELGLEVSDADVQAEIDTMVTAYYKGDQALLEEDLVAAGITLEQFKKEYWEYLISQKVYEEMTKDVPAATDEEVAAYYEANKASYYTPEKRTVRHILIMPGANSSDDTSTTSTTAAGATTTTTELTDADWAKALSTANEVRTKLVDGGGWAELAAEYSDDTYTKDSSGDLGAVGRGEMVQEFEEAVFSQDVDEISQPVRTIYGYHVIQVTGITEEVQGTLEEVKESILATLLEQAKFETWLKWVEEMKTTVGVIYREDLAPTTTTTAGQTITTATPGDTSDSTAGQSITTAAPATTTTSQP